MAKAAKSMFVCQACGASQARWAGKCAQCGEWNTLVEEIDHAPPPGSGLTRESRRLAVKLQSLKGKVDQTPRLSTGIDELDRTTGGGLVPASAILIGGEPGIGKSTLLLQLTARMASRGLTAVYMSGEEAVDQVRLRAARLGLSEAPVKLASETNLANILATLAGTKAPDLVIIDSVQTLWSDNLDGAPGTVKSGAGCRTLVDPVCQVRRFHSSARRACHEGRPDRRPESHRAHGRHGVVFRR